MDESAPRPLDDRAELLAAIKRNNDLIQQLIDVQVKFVPRFLGGVFAGLGTVVGATIVVAILVRILAPLASVERIGPYFKELSDALQRPSATKSQ